MQSSEAENQEEYYGHKRALYHEGPPEGLGRRLSELLEQSTSQILLQLQPSLYIGLKLSRVAVLAEPFN
jgi:hypothetical protein